MPAETAAATIPLDWTSIVIAGIVAVVLVIGFGALLWLRPDSFTRIRINLLWLCTLVAILTLVFGLRLIEILSRAGNSGSTTDTAGNTTVEIVLSSLVGVGIGGLIAIAGQLVQDMTDRSKDHREDSRD